jgi:uncharacterized protein (DUF608 family)
LSRRRFLALSAGAAGSLLAARFEVASALGIPEDQLVLVPADKSLSPEWVSSLAERGEPTAYRAEALRHIGMPVGGVTCGQLYLGGDGRLWMWDIYNPASSIVGGMDWGGSHYADPIEPVSPFRQGFALRTTAGGQMAVRSLDASGFDDVRFIGQYPIGRVVYRDPESPVEVKLEAFSPFVPLETDDSSLPATVLAYTLRNTSGRRVRAELAGWSETPVALESRRRQPIQLRSAAFGRGGMQGVEFGAAKGDLDDPRPEILFEDWEKTTYEGWTVEGEAFGPGPVSVAEVPDYMKRAGDLNAQGSRFVTSHHFRAGGDIPRSDSFTGKLTSRRFTIERRYVHVRVGGGNWRGGTAVNVVVEGAEEEVANPRTEIVFEDWERESYEGWTVEGEAFGSGPVTVAEVPDYMKRSGDLNAHGSRFVTSHHFRSGADVFQADTYVGKLKSRPFTIERRFINVRVGGGSWPRETSVNVVVEGAVVASVSGRDQEPMTQEVLDVRAWEGRTATIEIVDDRRGGWGHVNTDRIVFSDIPARPLQQVVATVSGRNNEVMASESMDVHRWEGKSAYIEIIDDQRGEWGHVNADHIVFSDVPADPRPLSELPDVGTFALAALDEAAITLPSLADWSDPDAVFDAGRGPTAVDGSERTIAGAVRVPVELRPGESRTVRFVVGWHFPVPNRDSLAYLQGADTLRRHYARRFDSAQQVVRYVATNLDRLEGGTRRWVDTWYTDSTLPHWFLERTLSTASTLATNTCYRFEDGRFYGWEGVYCCPGTCQHVWNYAQSVARLFPSLERDTRERIDLGLALNPNGAMDYRAEAERRVAHDGQAGTILRVYREHQMAPNDAFLRRVWPGLKRAIEFMIGEDGEPDGILEGEQYNTLDASWYGEIPWISGLYVAALRAGAEMASEAGDRAFAQWCQRLADQGSACLSTALWNDEYGYFIHRLDPARLDAINSNDGCYIDQMYGQTYAHQLGLPRVFPEGKSRTALTNLFRYNFKPDPAAYREQSEIPGGRWFAGQGEPGLVMCTWPFGGAEKAPGENAWFAVGYFDENWTGTEYQAAAHMLAEGLVEEGLIVTRAVHDRYSASKRNPYNEIECSDHYSRAMMSHAVYLAICGYEHHGPKGHLGFAPKLRPEDFRAAFTAATGWGSYRQRQRGRQGSYDIELRHGRLRLSSLAFAPPARPERVDVSVGRRRLRTRTEYRDGRLEIELLEPVVLEASQTLRVETKSDKTGKGEPKADA